MSRFQLAFGVGGVPPHENARAHRWEHRLRWIMAGVALLAVPAFYLENQIELQELGGLIRAIDVLIVFAFTLELAWMLKLVDQRLLYLRYNWLDVLIILCALLSFSGVATELVALGRFLRFALIALLLVRAAASIRGLFLPGRVRYLLLINFGLWLLSAVGLYWLEPTIHTFGDGLWLAFVTGATVGYGDLVPTTVPARFFAMLSVLVGFTLLSLMTAYIASMIIGEEDKRLRREMHEDIRRLRDDVQQMVTAEELAIRRDLHRDIRELKAQIAELRRDLGGRARKADEDR